MPAQPITQATLHSSDPVLRQIAKPVPEDMFDTPELTQIITNMIDTLDGQSDGVALAAPQIGISYRIFVVRFDRTFPVVVNENEEVVERKPTDVGIFINPEFVRSSRRRVEMDEGCLSVRGYYGSALRYERATLRARTPDGKRFERGGGGLLAQIFQHETDHLDGILFIDHAVDIVETPKKEKNQGALLPT